MAPASAPASTSGTTRLLSARGSVIAETRTNQLFVSDIPSRLAQVTEMIQKLDVPVRQVLIEARIVEASDTFGKSLCVKLGRRGAQRQQQLRYAAGHHKRCAHGRCQHLLARNPADERRQPLAKPDQRDGEQCARRGDQHDVHQHDGEFLDLELCQQQLHQPAGSARSGAQPGAFALSLFSSSLSRILNLEISALEEDGKGKVVSSPAW